MNSLTAVLKKSLLPLLGLSLTLALVLQMRGPHGLLAGRSLAGLTSSSPASADAAALTASTAEGNRVIAEGRLVTYPGAEVVVGADIAGTLVRFLVTEKQAVRKGQLLAELRADDLRAELAEAKARVDETDADIRFADVDAGRAEHLLAREVGTQEAVDRARRNRDAAYARRDTAQAAVRRLEAVLAKTRIVAPLDGVVIARHADAGERVDAGDPLVTVADLRKTRVEAEVDEFDAGRVALGVPVVITAEGWSGRSWGAEIEEIPDTVVTRRLKPQDPGRPSDTRVLLVKIALTEPTPLKLGQRVEVAITPRG
jgi:RND family efflux transporter MFP subunit